MAINMDLWVRYLSGRGVESQKIQKLQAGKGKVDDVDDATEGNQAVNIEDGLNALEMQSLGIRASVIDYVIDDEWKLTNEGKARTSGAIDIKESDLVGAEGGISAWAESHGLDPIKAQALYYADPDNVHEEDPEKVKTARKAVISAIYSDFKAWKGKQSDGSDKSAQAYLKSMNPNIPDNISSMDSEKILQLAYLSTFSEAAQIAYGITTPITVKYNPVEESVYDKDSIYAWLTNFAPAAREEDVRGPVPGSSTGDEPPTAAASAPKKKEDPKVIRTKRAEKAKRQANAVLARLPAITDPRASKKIELAIAAAENAKAQANLALKATDSDKAQKAAKEAEAAAKRAEGYAREAQKLAKSKK